MLYLIKKTTTVVWLKLMHNEKTWLLKIEFVRVIMSLLFIIESCLFLHMNSSYVSMYVLN